jgi:probable phosphoglycerate mutase
MTRLLLVRHGDSQAHNDGIIAGPVGCTGLSDAGRRQVDRLGARLAVERIEVDAVLTSPLRRAVETAEPLAQRLRTAVRLDADLEELRPGQADGLTTAALQARYGQFDMVDEPLRPIAHGGRAGLRSGSVSGQPSTAWPTTTATRPSWRSATPGSSW